MEKFIKDSIVITVPFIFQDSTRIKQKEKKKKKISPIKSWNTILIFLVSNPQFYFSGKKKKKEKRAHPLVLFFLKVKFELILNKNGMQSCELLEFERFSGHFSWSRYSLLLTVCSNCCFFGNKNSEVFWIILTMPL